MSEELPITQSASSKPSPSHLRNKEMRETQKTISNEIEAILALNIWGEKINALVFELFKHKASKPGVRGYFIRKIYEYVFFLGKQEGCVLRGDIPDEIFRAKLPFLMEAVISLQYLHNQILDQKGGVTTPKKINNNLLAGNLFGLFLRRDYLNRIFANLKLEDKEKTRAILDRMLELVDLGQILEKHNGTYDVFLKGLPDDAPIQIGRLEQETPSDVIDAIWVEIRKDRVSPKHEQFVKQYLKRTYLCNAALFVLGAELVMDLLGYEGSERQNILKFAACYGMMLQLVNDNNDYLPIGTVEKIPEDSYSDLRNRTMSLPLIYYFSINPEPKELFSRQNEFEKEESKTILSEMLPILIDYSIPLAQRVGFMAKKSLNPSFPGYHLFLDMIEIAVTNKFNKKYKIENANLKY